MRTLRELRDLQNQLDIEALAKALTQKEWDMLYPPHTSETEPSDASGFTETYTEPE